MALKDELLSIISAESAEVRAELDREAAELGKQSDIIAAQGLQLADQATKLQELAANSLSAADQAAVKDGIRNIFNAPSA